MTKPTTFVSRARPTIVDRLRKAAFYDAAERIEDLEGAIRQYIREVDSPVPDYTLRRLYREHMRKLIDASGEAGR